MAWAPDYVETAALRAFLRITDGADDTLLALAIAASSRAVDKDAGRQFGSVSPAEERFYTAEWSRRRGRWLIPIDDVQNITGLAFEVQEEDGTTVGAIDAYTLEPRNALAKGKPYELVVVSPESATMPTGCRPGEVAGTGLWGWTAYPDVVVMATELQASRLVARRGSPFGVAGSPDVGSELRLLDRVDPDVHVMLGDVRRWWAAA